MNFKIWLEENNITNQYWGGFNLVTLEKPFILVHLENDKILKLPIQNNITKISEFPLNQVLIPAWVKYFEYDNNNIINYVENRAADCLVYNKDYNAFYLIYRKSQPIGLAIPGGFIDNSQDGFSSTSPPDPQLVSKKAAVRELSEETGFSVSPSELIYLGKFDASEYDPREVKSYSWAYLYHCPTEQMKNFKAGDDATMASGSESMRSKNFKGWYKVDEIPELAFGHHEQIIKTALSKISN